jgi:uncharacterized protein (TIGR04222 family)
MSPLNLTGPQFLLFYLAWGVGGLLLAWTTRASRLKKLESSADARRWNPGYYPEESEAYAIAFLRGGRSEAAYVLLGRLVSAGLVEVTEDKVRRVRKPKRERHLLPIENIALLAVQDGGAPGQVETAIERAVSSDLDSLELDLERQGLLLSAAEQKNLRKIQGLALLAVSGLGLAKLAVALSRGKPNIGFLLLLLAAYTLAALLLLRPLRISPPGRFYLEWLRESHQGLVPLAANDGAGLAVATSIFGHNAVPDPTETIDRRHRKPERDGGGGCGAGAGDSGGDSGGGGDGGGSGGGDGGGSGCGGCGGGH